MPNGSLRRISSPRFRQLKKRSTVNIEIQQAERDYDLNRAAELKYGLTDLHRQLEVAETIWLLRKVVVNRYYRGSNKRYRRSHFRGRHSDQQAG